MFTAEGEEESPERDNWRISLFEVGRLSVLFPLRFLCLHWERRESTLVRINHRHNFSSYKKMKLAFLLRISASCFGVSWLNMNWLYRGQLVAIVGPVGSGKSSLAAALLGDMQQLSGPRFIARGTLAYCAQQVSIKRFPFSNWTPTSGNFNLRFLEHAWKNGWERFLIYYRLWWHFVRHG